ncbi:hypothetical protein ACFFQW_33515 [Umezawaea endophytica]|uniref:Uncharacterized protein n=1 Tax=Umezawaea endophytica TaxID=1654476 RepID=A0A9X2VPV9_9PSEU|nr:hypothetical protein [Umezawaea endophytica]MCS7480491.1 hypothetical protein [Umezawaea endophytica]
MVETEGDWGLGTATHREAVAAREWLVRRGALVHIPRPLLTVRLGQRNRRRVWFGYYAVFVVLAFACYAFVHWLVPDLPDVRDEDMTEGLVLTSVYCALQLATWRTWSRVDRGLASHEALNDPSLPRPPWRTVLGGWFTASTAVTFVGGAGLGVAMVVTTPARTYASSWLGLLAIGALSTAVVLTGVLRAPVIADDEATRAVDDLVRTENANHALPAMFAVPVVFDLFEGKQPSAFTGVLIGYVVLSVGLQLVAVVVHSRQVLPPGDYGPPSAEPVGSAEA